MGIERTGYRLRLVCDAEYCRNHLGKGLLEVDGDSLSRCEWAARDVGWRLGGDTVLCTDCNAAETRRERLSANEQSDSAQKMTKLTQPGKWHGGKFHLAKRIIELMPPHVHYVETHFGMGSVLLQKDFEGVSEVVNDIDGRLTAFWKALQSPTSFEAFCRLIDATPLSQIEWRQANTTMAAVTTGKSLAERGAAFFINNRQSRQGLGKDFATLSRNRTRRGMNEQVSSWLTAIEGLPEIHERLKRVVILNDDALKVIRQQDGPNTLFYCDPPYLAETRSSGEYEMTYSDHVRLLALLGRSVAVDASRFDDAVETLGPLLEWQRKGKFLLSGYPSSLYYETAGMNTWHRVDIQIDNKASSAKTKEIKTVCMWAN
ncbi:hypothetical protein LCGC14_1028170 [marine sediment metagenome]|uniref:Site-specific DNA-methyltransferase (adenine-specific) n=1 Tax=marine sediment metagenome TaxID=412755 RepID=A0A0F9MVG9_9ZZZZ